MNKLSTLLASVKQQIGFVYAPQTPVMVDLVEAQRLAAEQTQAPTADQHGVSGFNPAHLMDSAESVKAFCRDVLEDDPGATQEQWIEWLRRGLTIVHDSAFLNSRGTKSTADQHAAGSVEAERAAFETWARCENSPMWVADITRHNDGYVRVSSDMAWAAWQARAALASAKPVAAGELPKLPETAWTHPNDGCKRALYTADQMRAYGQQCADSRPAGGVADLVAEIRALRCGHACGATADQKLSYALGFDDAIKAAATLAASAVLTPHDADIERMLDDTEASAVQAGAVPHGYLLVGPGVIRGEFNKFTDQQNRAAERLANLLHAAAPNNTEKE